MHQEPHQLSYKWQSTSTVTTPRHSLHHTRCEHHIVRSRVCCLQTCLRRGPLLDWARLGVVGHGFVAVHSCGEVTIPSVTDYCTNCCIFYLHMSTEQVRIVRNDLQGLDEGNLRHLLDVRLKVLAAVQEAMPDCEVKFAGMAYST